jgi:hypothetical protein
MHCGINQKVKHAGSTFGVVKNYLKALSSSNRCTFRICPDNVCSYCHTSLLPLASEYYRHRVKKIFGMTHCSLMPTSTLPTFHVSCFVQL